MYIGTSITNEVDYNPSKTILPNRYKPETIFLNRGFLDKVQMALQRVYQLDGYAVIKFSNEPPRE